jgi:tRNA pseudouridine13 synthase
MEELALNPPRVAAPLGRARLREVPEDFVVDEVLGFTASGQGEHALLRVRKRGSNTGWVAKEIATRAGVRPYDVGYAGLKDRHAVTTQWYTVPTRRRPAADWLGVQGDGYEVIEAYAHSRKLPRGALEANRFAITLRGYDGDIDALRTRAAEVARTGVPNYFGPQRFGRDLANLRPGDARDAMFRWSASRSLIFNAVLAERITAGNWNRLHIGERANLDGRNSSFVVEALDAALQERLDTLDIHPTGPMWGEGGCGVEGEMAEFETAIAARYPEFLEWLRADRLAAARRPLRVAVRELSVGIHDDGTPILNFTLRSGSFATTVLREFIDVATGEGSSGFRESDDA